ncbi:LemA family protein [Candidatus Sumerlaeota bacterium]|nr:LemA family protein [Candidatus Sumerlaeota bacterium]
MTLALIGTGAIVGIVVAAVVFLLILWVVAVFNGLVRLKNRVENAWSQIDVQLKRRYDLIPNLLETVKGYLKHERETLENVTKARQQAIDAKGVADQAQAENFLSQTLRSLFAVTEAYPDLKADQNMARLQEELRSTENKIAFSRQHYNDEALQLNNRVQMFPGNIVAGMFGFKEREFFEVELEQEREAPKVSFGG